jgi:hypothetical protein
MQTGAMLGLDIGTGTVAAALGWPDGRRSMLLLDGALTEPAGVYVDPDTGLLVCGLGGAGRAVDRPDCYLPNPMSHLADGPLNLAGRQIPAVELVAALLRHVAAEAQAIVGVPVIALAMAVPADWGPRRRDLLRHAASTAGLPEPYLVSAPVAAATHLAAAGQTAVPAGGCVLVCDAGAGSLTLTVLYRTTEGFDILATTMVPGAAGSLIDEALAAHALTEANPDRWARLQQPTTLSDAQDRWRLWQSARNAKEALWHSDSTAVALPQPLPPTVVDRRVLATTTAPVLRRVGEAIAEVIDAADINNSHLAAVVLVGGGAPLLGLADTVATATGVTPMVAARPQHTVAEGLLHTADPAATNPADWSAPLPRPKATVRQMAAPVLIGAAAIALATQVLLTADVYKVTGLPTYVVTSNAQYGTAAALAALAGMAMAHAAASAALADTSTPPAAARRLGRRAYTAAAAISMAIALILGLFAGSYFELTVNPLLNWTLWAAAPVATATAALGLLIYRVPDTALRAWAQHTRPRILPVLLATVGMWFMWSELTLTPPASTMGGSAVIGRVGAGVLGVSIALTVTHTPILRTISGILLGVGAAAVMSLGNSRLLGLAYITAVGWWSAAQVVHTTYTIWPQALPALRARLAGMTSNPPR